MRKRTTVILDSDLLHDAEREFGTSGATETIHRVLKEALAFQSRKRLAQLDLPDLTPEALEEFRKNRDFAEDTETILGNHQQPA